MSMTICEILLPSAHLGRESILPSLYEMSNVQQLTKSTLDEDDELFVGYGNLSSIFPYRMQDLYDHDEELIPYIGIVLENPYLKAVFLPELGGRLWTLYDKVAKRDLIYRNPIVRPCNLAVRNAWLTGGIEFNCGMIGHGPYTCSRIHAVQTALSDGTPVLRMYEYERIRGAVYQMDFFLPEDSKQLFGRMRIVNPNEKTVPMYWWTNMGQHENPEARNVINTTVTYNNQGGVCGKNLVPFHQGIDITYPSNNPYAVDYFWKIPKGTRKYTSYIDREGYGFFQTSTSRLQGRKLFVWGQGEGGKRWEECLTKDGYDNGYLEIQAGLAYTQYECLPMPPKTAWEWMEAYGAISADPEKVHGDWDGCRAEVSARIDALLPEDKLEKLLVDTKPMALAPAQKRICYGSAWGKLENLRREKADKPIICPHLDFGELTEEQMPWFALMQNGTMQTTADVFTPPVSWMLQDEWRDMLEESAPCYEKYLHLAAMYMAEKRLRDADEALTEALALARTSSALFLKAQIFRMREDLTAAADTAMESYKLIPDDLSLARQCLTLAFKAEQYDVIKTTYEAAPTHIRADGRVTMLYTFALVRTGLVNEADTVFHRNGGLTVTDIRESEYTLTDLYIEIQQAKAALEGKTLEEDDIKVPRQFDFRLSPPKKK